MIAYNNMTFAVESLGKSSVKLCNYSPGNLNEALQLLQFTSFDDLGEKLTDGRLTLKIEIWALSSTVFKQFKK
jgi:hypothetical protein